MKQETNELSRTLAALVVLNKDLRSDRAIAEALAEQGYKVSQQGIWNYHGGRKTPPVGYLVAYVRAMELTDGQARELLRLYLHQNKDLEDFVHLWALLQKGEGR